MRLLKRYDFRNSGNFLPEVWKKKIAAELGDARVGAKSIKYFHSRKIISADKRCVMH
jgi:hypothetical protein